MLDALGVSASHNISFALCFEVYNDHQRFLPNMLPKEIESQSAIIDLVTMTCLFGRTTARTARRAPSCLRHIVFK